MRYEEVFPLPGDRLIDQEESLAEAVHRWGEVEVVRRRLEHREDYEELLAPAMHRLFVEIGLQKMIWSEESGGGGLESADLATTLVAALEQVGRADVGIAFLLANTLAIQFSFGLKPHRDEALCGRLAEVFCREPTAVGSLVLPGYGTCGGVTREGFHGLGYQVDVTPGSEGYVLNGEDVRPQCAGVTAGIFGVVCGPGNGGPAMLLVPASSEGLKRGESFRKTGLAASINADLTFHDVTIPREMAVFEGEERLRELLGWYHLGCSAACVGAMIASWEILKEWGETRIIKGRGQIFRNNPLAASLMGEIGCRTGLCRILAFDLARMLRGPNTGMQAMFATATGVLRHVMRTATESIGHAMELMASAGYATEWNLERYWRDVKTIETCLGPETAAATDMAHHYFGSEC